MITGVTEETVRALEGILMVAPEPVEPGLLAQLLEVSLRDVEQLCQQLAEAYETAGHGFQLVRVAGGYRYQSHPDVSPYVERFVLEGQSARISAAALETLAIIAYKQPVSRAQVAAIRGVDPDGVIRTLAQRGYIEQKGKDTGPGQAVLWGTTATFLEKLGLDRLEDLPPIAAFVPGADVVEALEHTLRPDTERPTPVSPPAAPAPAPLAPAAGSGADGAQAHPAPNGTGAIDVDTPPVIDLTASETVLDAEATTASATAMDPDPPAPLSPPVIDLTD